MPAKGTHPPVPLRPVARPNFSLPGIDSSMTEQWVHDDVAQLWAKLRALDDERRRQFLHAAAKWQEAAAQWGERPTLSFALKVVACEALKPPSPQFNDCTMYDVIEGESQRRSICASTAPALPPAKRAKPTSASGRVSWSRTCELGAAVEL